MSAIFRIIPCEIISGLTAPDKAGHSGEPRHNNSGGLNGLQIGAPIAIAVNDAEAARAAPPAGPVGLLPQRMMAPTDRGSAGLVVAAALRVCELRCAEFLLFCPSGTAGIEQSHLRDILVNNLRDLMNGQILRVRLPLAQEKSEQQPLACDIFLSCPAALIQAADCQLPDLLPPVRAACKADLEECDALNLCPKAWREVPKAHIIEDVFDVADNVVFIDLADDGSGKRPVCSDLPQTSELQAIFTDPPAVTAPPSAVTNTVVDLDRRFQVVRITVAPGAELPSQCHLHQDEHWIVVAGTATVRLDRESLTLCENQSVFVRLGTEHSLQNHGKVPVVMICVQTGSYLGADDLFDPSGLSNRFGASTPRGYLH